MYKKIESELLSILSEEYVEKIAHMPSKYKEIEKMMDLIYHIKFEDIERVYSEENDNYRRLVIIHNGDENEQCNCDFCVFKGKMCHITFIPSHLLDKSENNVKRMIEFVCKYIAIQTQLILRKRSSFLPDSCSTLDYVDIQSIPVLTCAIIRKLYSGASLSTYIYSVLSNNISMYKQLYTEKGIDSLLDLFDDGLTVEELLDNSFICAIDANDKKYPGIWNLNPPNEEEEKVEKEEK